MHTPGPWEIHEFGVHPSEGPTKYRIVDSEGVTVGFTYGYSRQDWLNGLVMKAAPDLLAACEERHRMALGLLAREFGSHGRYVFELQQFVRETAELLEPAIAKARGAA